MRNTDREELKNSMYYNIPNSELYQLLSDMTWMVSVELHQHSALFTSVIENNIRNVKAILATRKAHGYAIVAKPLDKECSEYELDRIYIESGKWK